MLHADLRQAAQIHHLGQRIRRRLTEQQACARIDRRFPAGQIAQRDIGGLDPEARQILVDQHGGAAENGARRKDTIARLQQPHANREDSRHP